MRGTLIQTRLATVQNRVLACMDPDAFDRLRPHLELIGLERRTVLQEHHRPIEHVYFIERGVASLFARTQRNGPVEVATIGRPVCELQQCWGPTARRIEG